MERVVVLDVSSTYTQIYDEIYCTKNDCEKIIKSHEEKGYICVKLSY